MIEDAELRELFQTESEEHLQSLDDGLLRLETNPQDSATLEEVFRAAHSLKGTARMLGVTGIETLAHHLEDELGNARRGRGMISPPVIDRMCVGLGAIRKLVDEAVLDIPSGVDIGLVLGQLKGTVPLENQGVAPIFDANGTTGTKSVDDSPDIAETAATQVPDLPVPLPAPTPDIEMVVSRDASETEAIELAPPPPQVVLNIDEPAPELTDEQIETSDIQLPIPELHAPETQPLETQTLAVQTSSAQIAELPGAETQLASTAKGDFRIQTMRVPPAKLDALMTLASELTVTTNRVNRGLAAFVEMGELWEEWNKDVSNQRPLFALAQAETAFSGTATNKMGEFHAREQERLVRLKVLWEHVRQTIYEDVTRLSLVAGEMEEGIRNVRLLPLSTIFNLFPRAVRDLARDQNKEVQFLIEGGDTTADKRILEELKDPLMHMIRNAVDHGIEPPGERERKGKPRVATMRLRACQTAINVIVELQDDGRGLDVEAIRRTALRRRLHSEEELQAMSNEQIQLLIFAPGFSTSPLVTDVSGRGVGLDVVRINIENLKGSVHVDSTPGMGCTFHIRLPLTLATTRVLLVEAQGRPYALPIEFVEGVVRVFSSQFFTIEGRETLVLANEAISIARLSHLLELPTQDAPASRKSAATDAAQVCVVISIGAEKLGVLVDALLDEQEVVLKPLGPMLKRVRNVSGATILGAGEVCMVLNPHDLVKSAYRSRPRALTATILDASEDETVERRKVILLAEDSITTRTQEKRILESAGYEVVTAVDGADAFGKLATREFDAVVSDVQMPNMDGLSLSAKIREDNKYKELPIILVTSLASDDDKRRGVEVGANAYITKGTFEQKVLLDTLRRLV